ARARLRAAPALPGLCLRGCEGGHPRLSREACARVHGPLTSASPSGVGENSAMPENSSMVRRVLVATDRSETAEVAVRFAAEMANRCGADLVLVQVVIPPATTSVAMTEDLVRHARDLAGDRGFGTIAVGEDPAKAIIDAAETENVDVVVVGNVGMSGRK